MTTALTFLGSEAESVPGGLLVRPTRRPDEGACGYRMRLAEENRLSYAQVLRLEEASALVAPADGGTSAERGNRLL